VGSSLRSLNSSHPDRFSFAKAVDPPHKGEGNQSLWRQGHQDDLSQGSVRFGQGWFLLT